MILCCICINNGNNGNKYIFMEYINRIVFAIQHKQNQAHLQIGNQFDCFDCDFQVVQQHQADGQILEDLGIEEVKLPVSIEAGKVSKQSFFSKQSKQQQILTLSSNKKTKNTKKLELIAPLQHKYDQLPDSSIQSQANPQQLASDSISKDPSFLHPSISQTKSAYIPSSPHLSLNNTRKVPSRKKSGQIQFRIHPLTRKSLPQPQLLPLSPSFNQAPTFELAHRCNNCSNCIDTQPVSVTKGIPRYQPVSGALSASGGIASLMPAGIQLPSLRSRREHKGAIKTEGSVDVGKQYQTELLKQMMHKKHTLKQKLKKLNLQLQSLSSSLAQQPPLTQSPQKNPSSRIPQSILSVSRSKKDEQQTKELMCHQNAIHFVSRVSQQSLKRRLDHKRKIAKGILQRVKEHACLQCSRGRCTSEIQEIGLRAENGV